MTPQHLFAAAFAREMPPVAPPVDCTDASAFPNIAAARAWLAGLSPDERALKNEGWE